MNVERISDGLAALAKKLLIAPLALTTGILEDSDLDILVSAVEKRTARAETAVLRDYFSQHGIEGEQIEQAAEEYRARRKGRITDPKVLEDYKKRVEAAEMETQKTKLSAEARVQMARMGIDERNSEDVLLLMSRELEQSQADCSDIGAVRSALEAVVARLPSLARPRENTAGATAGVMGNFPRHEDAALTMQSSLDRARKSGDNAAAVAIITSAAAKGITLR